MTNSSIDSTKNISVDQNTGELSEICLPTISHILADLTILLHITKVVLVLLAHDIVEVARVLHNTCMISLSISMTERDTLTTHSLAYLKKLMEEYHLMADTSELVPLIESLQQHEISE